MPEHRPLDGRVHHALLVELIATGRAPDQAALAESLGVGVADIEGPLERLHANHGVVLHPHERSLWIVHPFSLSPTINFVAGARHGWWAPCLWCAFGVALLVGEDVEIATRLGAEREELRLHTRAGQLVQQGLVVHFPLPPRRAWDNVHAFCAGVQPFRDEAEAAHWSARHGLARGAVLPAETLFELARHWYGGHLAPDWRKWSVAQAQAIFERVGLRGDFWRLAGAGERF